MCCTRVSKRYNAWVDKHEIHPLWLRLKDKELEEKVANQLRTQVFMYVKIVLVLTIVHGVITLMANMENTLAE